MLAQKNRFHGYGSLRYVFSHGQKARDKYLGIRSVKNSRREHTRVAVIVSKKISKSAVVRNRIRRRIYDIVRRQLESHRAVHDIVITVLSPEITSLTPDELTQSIIQLSANVGLYDIN